MRAVFDQVSEVNVPLADSFLWSTASVQPTECSTPRSIQNQIGDQASRSVSKKTKKSEVGRWHDDISDLTFQVPFILCKACNGSVGGWSGWPFLISLEINFVLKRRN